MYEPANYGPVGGQMLTFPVGEGTAPGFLSLPSGGQGPGVVVLHPWWGLTEPFRRFCDRLAQHGFTALAPDLYRGETTDTPEIAQALGSALDKDEARWRGDIIGAVHELHRHDPAGERGRIALVGFSLGGGYALDMSTMLADQIAAVVLFYAAWSEPEFARATAAYLCHYAEHDPFEDPGEAEKMERRMRDGGRSVLSHRYPGTQHWFFEMNRPEYHPEASALAWDRTVAFLHQHLG